MGIIVGEVGGVKLSLKIYLQGWFFTRALLNLPTTNGAVVMKRRAFHYGVTCACKRLNQMNLSLRISFFQ